MLAGLPDDYVDRSLALLRSVTPESATAAYPSLVRPDDLSLVVVGDAERIAEPLRGRRLRRPRGGHARLVDRTADGYGSSGHAVSR